jgi:hypothetical protein
MSQSNLSPRRVKPATVTVLYELRALRSQPPAAYLSRFEAKVRGWRGLQRWRMQAYTSARGETVLQVVAEKAAQSSRVDNAFSSWRRVLQALLPVPKTGASGAVKARAAWARGSWIAGDGQHSTSSWYADVKLLAEAYDVACAKLWEEARRADAGATRCSYLEPALPQLARRALQGTVSTPSAAAASASIKAAPPPAPKAAPSTGESAARAVNPQPGSRVSEWGLESHQSPHV